MLSGRLSFGPLILSESVTQLLVSLRLSTTPASEWIQESWSIGGTWQLAVCAQRTIEAGHHECGAPQIPAKCPAAAITYPPRLGFITISLSACPPACHLDLSRNFLTKLPKAKKRVSKIASTLLFGARAETDQSAPDTSVRQRRQPKERHGQSAVISQVSWRSRFNLKNTEHTTFPHSSPSAEA
ncbi:hypothetical protein IAQ61_011436 [Plenodomus lingam]|uniref:uncharacterized protein n=1 Tax=Leptosphaeria maculans TaxID=5022 RepID=UPI0033275D7A|nr:hypothetical protein IAQ61_011436 [Plenodomus lingam]